MSNQRGQTLIEFALALIFLLLFMFLLVETGRILWGWVSVQNAARLGARYAVTGNFEPEFAAEPDPRLASILHAAHRGLSGLPLNEDPGRLYEHDNFYLIQVFGTNYCDQAPGGSHAGLGLCPEDAGLPGEVVVVRVLYRVPTITPLFRPIARSIMVHGQVSLTNELFGVQGGYNQGVGLPPVSFPVPTVGPTPTPTPTPSPTATPSPGPTATATETPTPIPSATPVICPVRFAAHLVAGTSHAYITGDIGTTVTLFNLSTGESLATAGPLQDFDGHLCPGFVAIFWDTPLLEAGHTILVESSDTSVDTTIVLADTPTPSPTVTQTPPPTPTSTSTPTITPTPTPQGPYIVLLPNQGAAPSIQFTVLGFNWPNPPISLYWNMNELVTIIPAGHGGSFQRTLTFSGVAPGSYVVRATAGSQTATAAFTVHAELPPGATVTPTPTVRPVDLVIAGQPMLISTPPIVEYQPVQFQVVISNTGDLPINNQFFVDLYFDPAVVHPDHIPLNYSSGYIAVSQLGASSSQVLTITSPLGFTGGSSQRQVYSMVDSVLQVVEIDEENNIAGPVHLDVTPAASPTPTATPLPGATPVPDQDIISGIVRSRIGGQWVPQFRAEVRLMAGNTLVAVANSSFTGYYAFTGVPAGEYTVLACITIDNVVYAGQRTGITPPNEFASIFMLPGVCSP
jgi:hypothetical protein